MAGGIGLGGEQGADHGALGVRELAGKARGVDDLLTLIGRHLAEIENRAGHGAAARDGKRIQLRDGAAELLTLLRGEALQGFVAVQHAGALLRVHVVEASLEVTVALLSLRGQFVEAGELLEGFLLLGEREIAVIGHPLRDVLLIGGGAGEIPGASPGGIWGASSRPLNDRGGGLLLRGAAGEHRRCDEQQKKRRAETEPGWRMQFHPMCGAPNDRNCN